MKTSNLVVGASLLLISIGANAKEIPEACKTDCIANYGILLGDDPTGVKGFSNCNSSCVVFEPNKAAGVYTGIKWQCVEYARRWLYKNKGMVYGDVDYAIDIWDKIDHYSTPGTDETVATVNLVNGSSTPPKVGDLLIYAKVMFGGTGHVAVITDIDFEKQLIFVGEQNFANKKWPGDYTRKISFVTVGGQHWLHDPYLIGWKSVAD